MILPFLSQVLCLQPFNYAKNMTQQKQPISLNPMVMYRGVHANALNMGSCTMIQFAVGGRLKQMILQGDTRHLSLAEEMMAGIGAGTVSGLAGSPLELIMIQQQRKGKALGATIAEITANPANVGRGFIGCAIREALWTCGYLSIPPVVRRSLMGESFTVSCRNKEDGGVMPPCSRIHLCGFSLLCLVETKTSNRKLPRHLPRQYDCTYSCRLVGGPLCVLPNASL